MMRLIDCKEGNSSLSLMCRVLWELKSLGATTCLQMGHTRHSSSAAAAFATVVGTCQAFFLFLFFFPPPVPDCFSSALQSPWAVRSSCCLPVSGKRTSSSWKMQLKSSPSKSLQLRWYWAADITLWERGEAIRMDEQTKEVTKLSTHSHLFGALYGYMPLYLLCSPNLITNEFWQVDRIQSCNTEFICCSFNY